MSVQRKRKPRNTAGILALGLILAVDAVLVAWLWHWRQSRLVAMAAPAEESADLLLAPVPEDSEFTPATPTPGGRGPALELPASRLPVPFSQRLPPPARTAGAGARAAGSAAAAALGGRARQDMPAAERAYRSLKAQPRYRALAAAWTAEFIKHPDLRAINHQYWQDRDALAFILSAVRSPNFLTLLGSFAARPDLQGFLTDLAAQPPVAAASRWVLEDPAVIAAIQRVPIAGLGTIGSLSTPRR